MCPPPAQAPMCHSPHQTWPLPALLQPPAPVGSNIACVQAPVAQKPDQRSCITSNNNMHLLWEYNKKYLGFMDYDPSAAELGKSFY